MSSARKIAVIGGGWAGCSAAVELVRLGHKVVIFEAARTLGGRARRVEFGGRVLDNGQHILLGAYRESLRLMRTVGVCPETALLRLPLQMRYPQACGGMDFLTRRLPAPLHMLAGLWRASGLTREDKMALARFSTAARWMGWQLNADCSVTALLERFDQTERLIALMWRPLCIAALNTPPDRASAQVFLNVLRDSLGARRADSDMLLPRTDLSSLFPEPAASFIVDQGGAVRCGVTITRIDRKDGYWLLEQRNGIGRHDPEERFDAVILATPVKQAAALLDGLAETSLLTSLGHEPITTCYLQYGKDVRLPSPFLALIDRAETSEWGQFVFDRGWLDNAHRGLLAVVVSASNDATAMGREALAQAISTQLARAMHRPEFAAPEWSVIVTEKRATFSCTPGLVRPANTLGLPGIALAGDYTASDYPATIESAAKSGVQAARCILAE